MTDDERFADAILTGKPVSITVTLDPRRILGLRLYAAGDERRHEEEITEQAISAFERRTHEETERRLLAALDENSRLRRRIKDLER